MIRELDAKLLTTDEGTVLYRELAGLSTDTKPKGCATGSTFFEVNTCDVYVYDESNSGTWKKVGGS